MATLLQRTGFADPDKIAAINNTKAPKAVGKLQSFLGLPRSWRPYELLPHKVLNTSGLRHMNIVLRKSKMLLQRTVLWPTIIHRTSLFSPLKPALLASEQFFPPLITKCGFCQSLPQTKQGALAVVWGCKKFHMYLIGTRFTLYTDHKALEVIFLPKPTPPARIKRWALCLQQYDCHVQYRKGNNNPLVLSRMPLPHTCTKPSVADKYINFLAGHSVPKSMTLTEIQEFTVEFTNENAKVNQAQNWRPVTPECFLLCFLFQTTSLLFHTTRVIFYHLQKQDHFTSPESRVFCHLYVFLRTEILHFLLRPEA